MTHVAVHEPTCYIGSSEDDDRPPEVAANKHSVKRYSQTTKAVVRVRYGNASLKGHSIGIFGNIYGDIHINHYYLKSEANMPKFSDVQLPPHTVTLDDVEPAGSGYDTDCSLDTCIEDIIVNDKTGASLPFANPDDAFLKHDHEGTGKEYIHSTFRISSLAPNININNLLVHTNPFKIHASFEVSHTR